MFLSQHEIAQTREHALNQLQALSSGHLETSQRIFDLFSAASRDYIHVGSKQMAQFGHGQLDQLTQYPASLWLDNLARNSRLLDAAYEIMADAQKHLIENAEAQVKVFDELVFASIKRAARNSPWEAEMAFSAMRVSLESAEQTLHGMSNAAIQTVQSSEQEIHQISECLSEPETTSNQRVRRRRTAKTTV